MFTKACTRFFYKKPDFFGLTGKIGQKNKKLTNKLLASNFQKEIFSVRNLKYIFQQCKSKIHLSSSTSLSIVN